MDQSTQQLKLKFDTSNGGHSNLISSLAKLPNGYLASGSIDSTIKIWDIENGKLKFTLNESNGGHHDNVETLVVLENGYLATVDRLIEQLKFGI